MPDARIGPAARIDAAELGRVLALLRRLFDIRITFYDGRHDELDDRGIKERSPYCNARRRDPAFRQRCDACDRRHLALAVERRGPLAYRCHDGLFEAVVPVLDRHGHHLGALMLGQLRPHDDPAPAGPGAALRAAMPAWRLEQVQDIADLLQRVADHLLARQVLVRTSEPWVEAAEAFIEAHLGDRITAEGLARAIGRSPSFVTHHFRRVFGRPLRDHVAARRLAIARERVLAGEPLRAIAGDLGFCDEFHLSRAFKACWGVPPGRLRGG